MSTTGPGPDREKDRRGTRRHRVQESAFAVIRPERRPFRLEEDMFMVDVALAVFRSRPAKMGPILDISASGLAVQCFEEPHRVQRSHVMDLLVAESGFFIQGLHFAVVADIPFPGERQFGPLLSRRLSVRFERIGEGHRREILRFIEKYTIR
jgi:hypothetical protein